MNESKNKSGKKNSVPIETSSPEQSALWCDITRYFSKHFWNLSFRDGEKTVSQIKRLENMMGKAD